MRRRSASPSSFLATLTATPRTRARTRPMPPFDAMMDAHSVRESLSHELDRIDAAAGRVGSSTQRGDAWLRYASIACLAVVAYGVVSGTHAPALEEDPLFQPFSALRRRRA